MNRWREREKKRRMVYSTKGRKKKEGQNYDLNKIKELSQIQRKLYVENGRIIRIYIGLKNKQSHKYSINHVLMMKHQLNETKRGAAHY